MLLQKLVKMANSGAASDENFINMTFPFQRESQLHGVKYTFRQNTNTNTPYNTNTLLFLYNSNTLRERSQIQIRILFVMCWAHVCPNIKYGHAINIWYVILHDHGPIYLYVSPWYDTSDFSCDANLFKCDAHWLTHSRTSWASRVKIKQMNVYMCLHALPINCCRHRGVW